MTTIREGRPEDSEALREIQRALAEPSPALLDAALAGPIPLLVRVDSKPVGYAIAIEGPTVYVPELAVHPDRQGEGHGSALVTALCERFDGREEIRLTVAADNDRARRFYDRHGFERVEYLEGFFERGDALVLARSP